MSVVETTPTRISVLTTYLPDGFQPSESEVMIGRGRKILQHSGNVKLRDLVQTEAKDYCQTADKTFKSFIISEIGNRVKRESAHGGFVKKDGRSGRWCVVSDSCVRATIAQTFRDCLSPNYRSSKFSKQRRRRRQKTTTDTAPSRNNVGTGSSLPLLAVSKEVSSLGKPVEQQGCSPSGLQPLKALSLKSALHLPSSSMGMPPLFPPMAMTVSSMLPSSSPTSVAESTSNILKKYLDILDDFNDDGCEAWISYTENPFEPNPIPEGKVGSGAMKWFS